MWALMTTQDLVAVRRGVKGPKGCLSLQGRVPSIFFCIEMSQQESFGVSCLP